MATASVEEIHGPERIPFSSADQVARAVEYDNLEAPAALRSFLGTLFRCGYARVRGVPTSTKELARFARRVGFAGDASELGIFDELVEATESADVISSRSNSPHTDGAYCDPAPSFHAQLCVEDNIDGFSIMILCLGLVILSARHCSESKTPTDQSPWNFLI